MLNSGRIDTFANMAAHIPRARPRIFGEKCINTDRDKRLRDMGIPMVSTDARMTANPDAVIHEVQVLMGWYDYWADKYKIKYLCRQHEKGFKNFYLPYEFNEKSFYEGEGLLSVSQSSFKLLGLHRTQDLAEMRARCKSQFSHQVASIQKRRWDERLVGKFLLF